MFAARYFAGVFFPRAYFPAVGGAVSILNVGRTGVRSLVSVRGVAPLTPVRGVRAL